MKIGFISTWFERGAAYVTKSYMNLLGDHDLLVYARGGEDYAIGDPNWDWANVTWGLRLSGTKINFKHFKDWIQKNNIETLFFNEQKDISIVIQIKKEMPHLKIGTYVDYYKEDTIKDFNNYDFLICNTKRHYSVFKHHPQCYYIPWGTDIDVFKFNNRKNDLLTFFHSVGMSKRKGTNQVVDAFIQGGIYTKAKLLIHSQIDIEKNFGYKIEYLEKHNIEVIEKTITAPGLYYLADVYVYPTTLDGLGLTMYEALSSGLPIITTNNAPMNEIVNKSIGYLVEVEKFTCREDAYYWPLSHCNMNSLIEAYNFYLNNTEDLLRLKYAARNEAIEKWNWNDRKEKINEIFNSAKVLRKNNIILETKKSHLYKDFIKQISPDWVVHYAKKKRK